MTFNRFVWISFVILSMQSMTQSMICPNKSTECRDGMTCCKRSSDESDKYGCCPLESAECCADGLHCCPNGTKCNNKVGACDQLNTQIKQIRLKTNEKIKVEELCPDRNKTCLKYETCCRLKTGGYGCCPYNSGVCCKDLLHCCPHNTRCDLAHKQCVRPDIKFVLCPGARYDCPDGNTCCQISDTQWGCCPLRNAVCCVDRIHCCPEGMKCTDSGCDSMSRETEKYFY